jgi:hypothetical protein
MFPFPPAILFELEAIGAARFLLDTVISLAAAGAFEPHILTHQLAPALALFFNDDCGF